MLKEVDIYLLKHTRVVHGCAISKTDQIVSKPIGELSHIYKQNADKPRQLESLLLLSPLS